MYFSLLPDAHQSVRHFTDGQYCLETDADGVHLVYKATGQKTQIMQPAAADFDFTKVDALSSRERQVFEMLGEGRSLNEIAERMALSVKTVETYRARIKDKFDVPTACKSYAWH